MDLKTKDLIKNTIIIFIGKTSTQLISFLLLPLYTFSLSTKEFGIYDLVQTYVTLLVPIISIQTGMSIFRYLVDSRDKKEKTEILLNNNSYIIFILLAIFSLIYFVVSLFINIPYKTIIYLTIIACVLNDDFLQVARGQGKIIDYSISSIITGVFTILLNLILILGFKLKEEAMIISLGLANFIGFIYIFIKLKLYKNINFKKIDKKIIYSMILYSLPLVPNSIGWWIVNVSDRTIISYFLGSGANGIYSVSNKFPTILLAFLGIFNLSWSESSAVNINSKDREVYFSKIINSSIKIFSTLALILISSMPFIFPLLVNDKFNDAINYIPIITLAYAFNVVIVLYTGIYIGLKKTREVMNTTIIGAVVNIIFNLLLINYLGIYAAAISTLLSFLSMVLYRYFDLKKHIKISFNKKLILSLIIAFILTLIVYYMGNIILKVIMLGLIIIYSFILNKDLVLLILNKLKGMVGVFYEKK